MKIDASARLDALTHKDPTVRNTILDCCHNFDETSLSVTRKVINAIDTYGLEEAYGYAHKICKTDLDEEAADWLIQLIENIDASTYSGNNSLAHLTVWFIRKAPT